VTKKVYVPGLIALLSAICLTSLAFAQTAWTRTYGGTSDDWGNSVRQTTDGGYIVVGYTYSFGAGYSDVYLIKADASGETLWTRTYGGAGSDEGCSLQQTTDGGYIIAGNGDDYLIKTNASGDTLWTRAYCGTQGDGGQSVQQTTDGGYIIAGGIYFGAGDWDVYLIKTNASGDTLWTRTYGGTREDRGRSVQQTADGGYVIAGSTRSFGAGGYNDVYLIKTNDQGDTLWTRTYGGTGFDSNGSSVQQTTDGGYIITGYTSCFGAGQDVYLIKTNAQGDTLWTRTYGGLGIDEGYSLQQTTGGGYIIAGSTNSFGAGDWDVYLIKTNASGDTLWTRTYGGTNGEWGNSVRQTTDGGYIITGYTYSYSFGAGGQDVYLIKTDANGNAGIEEPMARRPACPTGLLVKPTPFTSFARVPGHETELFALTDVAGRQVAICKGDRIGEGLRPGVYFLSLVRPKTGKAATAIIIKAAY